MTVLIFGGGRWARLYCRIIENELIQVSTIFMYSPSLHRELKVWVKQQELKKTRVIASLNHIHTKPSYGFVVNSAGDHCESTIWCSTNSIDVLVEKPLCSNLVEFSAIMECLNKSTSEVSMAQVFLFSDSVAKFQKLIRTEEIVSISLRWIDCKDEFRHGAQKNYDPSLILYQDVLPHIISIFSGFLEVKNVKLVEIDVEKGGAVIQVLLQLDEIKITLFLERMGKTRERCCEVKCINDFYELDFSTEPGIISINGNKHDFVSTTSSPLTSMISSFLAGSDRIRFDVNQFEKVLYLINMLEKPYTNTLLKWWKKELVKDNPSLEYLKYSVLEILSGSQRTSNPVRIKMIESEVENIISEKYYFLEKLEKGSSLCAVLEG